MSQEIIGIACFTQPGKSNTTYRAIHQAIFGETLEDVLCYTKFQKWLKVIPIQGAAFAKILVAVALSNTEIVPTASVMAGFYNIFLQLKTEDLRSFFSFFIATDSMMGNIASIFNTVSNAAVLQFLLPLFRSDKSFSFSRQKNEIKPYLNVIANLLQIAQKSDLLCGVDANKNVDCIIRNYEKIDKALKSAEKSGFFSNDNVGVFFKAIINYADADLDRVESFAHLLCLACEADEELSAESEDQKFFNAVIANPQWATKILNALAKLESIISSLGLGYNQDQKRIITTTIIAAGDNAASLVKIVEFAQKAGLVSSADDVLRIFSIFSAKKQYEQASYICRILQLLQRCFTIKNLTSQQNLQTVFKAIIAVPERAQNINRALQICRHSCLFREDPMTLFNDIIATLCEAEVDSITDELSKMLAVITLSLEAGGRASFITQSKFVKLLSLTKETSSNLTDVMTALRSLEKYQYKDCLSSEYSEDDDQAVISFCKIYEALLDNPQNIKFWADALKTLCKPRGLFEKKDVCEVVSQLLSVIKLNQLLTALQQPQRHSAALWKTEQSVDVVQIPEIVQGIITEACSEQTTERDKVKMKEMILLSLSRFFPEKLAQLPTTPDLQSELRK